MLDDDTFPDGYRQWGRVLIVQIRKYICHNRVSTQLRRLPLATRVVFRSLDVNQMVAQFAPRPRRRSLVCMGVKPSVVAPGGPRMPPRPVWLIFGGNSLSLSFSLPLLKGVSLCKHTAIMESFSVCCANVNVGPSFSPSRGLISPALIRNIRAHRAQQISTPYCAAPGG